MRATRTVPAQAPHLPTPRYFRFGFALSSTLTRSRRPRMWFLFVAWQVLVWVRLATILCQLTGLHSQASSPRFVAAPQLPSPRVCFLKDFHLVYWLLWKYRNSTQGTKLSKPHPISTRPCRAYLHTEPRAARLFLLASLSPRPGERWRWT